MIANASKLTSDLLTGATELDELELKRLNSENISLKAQIRRLRRYIVELEQTADKDSLVPVYNRRAFMRELAWAQSVMDRYQIPSTIIYIDLDDFKSVIDRFEVV